MFDWQFAVFFRLRADFDFRFGWDGPITTSVCPFSNIWWCDAVLICEHCAGIWTVLWRCFPEILKCFKRMSFSNRSHDFFIALDLNSKSSCSTERQRRTVLCVCVCVFCGKWWTAEHPDLKSEKQFPSHWNKLETSAGKLTMSQRRLWFTVLLVSWLIRWSCTTLQFGGFWSCLIETKTKHVEFGTTSRQFHVNMFGHVLGLSWHTKGKHTHRLRRSHGPSTWCLRETWNPSKIILVFFLDCSASRSYSRCKSKLSWTLITCTDSIVWSALILQSPTQGHVCHSNREK